MFVLFQRKAAESCAALNKLGKATILVSRLLAECVVRVVLCCKKSTVMCIITVLLLFLCIAESPVIWE